MKFSLLSLIPAALAVSVAYDTGYDDGARPLTLVACSDGPNGLISKGYTDQQSLPTFPFIGGVPAIAGWNSDKCGSCWAITYKDKTIHVLGIDTGVGGANIGLFAMNELTHGQATQLGRVEATVSEVASSNCGL